MLEKTLESPLDCKEIQPVHPKGNQSWMFIGRTDVEAETPILWPPDAKNWLIWTDPDVAKDWGQEEMGMTEEEMVGCHHWLSGGWVWWAPGVCDWQGGLMCCSLGVTKSWTWLSDWTELNWTEGILCVSKLISIVGVPICISIFPNPWKSFFLHILAIMTSFVHICMIL